MGMNVGGNKGGPMGDINVTPLVDVVLVLLIIFMVVTPMLTSGVDVKLPNATTTESTQDLGQHLVISIDSEGIVYVEADPTDTEQLVDSIDRKLAGNTSRSLLIKGDQGLQWGQVRDVMDTIHDAKGMDTMLLAAEKIKE
ncbi:MAG: biopolymer transport protein TolR [Myxococcota bacterium]|jgi:biopolymer transport protein TolR